MHEILVYCLNCRKNVEIDVLLKRSDSAYYMEMHVHGGQVSDRKRRQRVQIGPEVKGYKKAIKDQSIVKVLILSSRVKVWL